MVQNLGQCGGLAPERIAKTVGWKRLPGFAAENVMSFPSGTIFAIAISVAKSSATSANILLNASYAKRLFAVNAKTIG
jgi:hypothetical protein